MGLEGLLQNEGSVSTDPLAQAARERIAGKKKPGRPRGAMGGGSVGSAETVPNDEAMQEALAKHREALERLWNPSTWARVASAPFDVLLLATGKKSWDLTQAERSDLGESSAMCLQFWSTVDPRWLALANFLGTMTSIAAARWVLYRTEIVREESARKRGMDTEGGG